MRFFRSANSITKLTAVAAALMILPVAVACDTQTPETVDNVGTEVPADTTEVPVDTATDTMPTEGETIVDVAAANGSFNTLVAAINAAGLADTLSAEGPYTVFAPTDEAFAALPEGVLEQLLLPENQEALTSILTYHVVPGEIPASEIESGAVGTVEGGPVDVTADGGTVMVNGATVTQPDVMASNGVIHVIDQVLLPPTLDISML